VSTGGVAIHCGKNNALAPYTQMVLGYIHWMWSHPAFVLFFVETKTHLIY